MRKKMVLGILIVSLFTFMYSPQITTVQSASIIDSELANLKKMKEEAQRKAKEAADKISAIQNEQEVTKEQMEILLNELDIAGAKLSKLNEQIGQVTNDLVENGKLLDSANERVNNRQEVLKSRIRLMYMNGIVSYMDVLLSSTSFTDFLNRMELLTSIAAHDKELLSEDISDRNIISEKKKQTEEQLNKVKQLYAESNQVRQELILKEREKETRLTSLQEQEQLLEGITEENERLLIEFAKQEAALIKKKGELSNLPYNGGKLGYPLIKTGILTSYFGYRVDPITGVKGAYHSGIDLAAPLGTGIVAAETGIVIVASWFGGYGNCIMIDHGKNTWTLYGHIRYDGIFVQKGQKVTKGQKIAEVGSTGRSTGNHLHFEVRLNEYAVDPMTYLR